MKKTTFFNAFFATLISLAFSVNTCAAKKIQDCEQSEQSRIAHSQCLDRKIDAIDRELQTWINNQTFVLEELAQTTGRHSSLEMFRRSQRNFTTYRENNCRWQYLYVLPNVDAAPAYKKCYILLSRNRIKELSQINNSK